MRAPLRYLLIAVVAGLGALGLTSGAVNFTVTAENPTTIHPSIYANAAPVDFGSDYIVDESNALSGNEAQLQTVISELAQKTGVSLFIAFVSDFDQPDDAVDWAEATAINNQLGRLGVLLAVATDSREYGYSFDVNFPLSDDEIFTIEEEFLLPALSQSDWYLGAEQFAVGLAEGFGETLDTAQSALPPPPPATPQPNQPDSPDQEQESGGLSAWWLLIPGVPIVAVLVYASRKRRDKQAPDPQKISLKDLSREVSSALINLDDAIKLSEQELGFAQAQFGSEATTEFSKILQQASENMRQAFRLKQQLDDHVKDTEEETRAWSSEILRLCTEASTLLDGQEQAFDELRELETQAPKLLGELEESLENVTGAINHAETIAQQLASQYSAESLTAIAENPKQARTLQDFAKQRLAEASDFLGTGNTAKAAIALRAAQQSLDQTEQLTQAVSQTQSDLHTAAQQLSSLRSELQQDLQAASGLTAPAALAVLEPLRQVQQRTESALAQSAGENPLTELAQLEDLNSQLDLIFAQTQDQVMRQQRALANLERTVFAAESAIAEANQYLTTRRGGVRVDARTRLADARNKLAEAQSLAANNPERALQLATQAVHAAQQSTQLASIDVQQRSNPASNNADWGALLGGILGGALGSSSRNRGSRNTWGSGNRSSRSSGFGGFGGFGGSGGSRSSRGGGFGGGRSSGRSSGGRRSGGGRF